MFDSVIITIFQKLAQLQWLPPRHEVLNSIIYVMTSDRRNKEIKLVNIHINKTHIVGWSEDNKRILRSVNTFI